MIDQLTRDLRNVGIRTISPDLGTSRSRFGGRTYLCVRELQQKGAPVKTSEVGLYHLEYFPFFLTWWNAAMGMKSNRTQHKAAPSNVGLFLALP